MSKVFGKNAIFLIFGALVFSAMSAHGQDLGSSSGIFRSPKTEAKSNSATRPHMELLSSRLNETVNLMIRVGTKVRFLETVEGTSTLRVGDRQGTVLPANKASGGKAMLAELEPALIEQLFRSQNAEIGGDSIPDAEYPAFLRELEAVRGNGFAANFEGTEEGISALGMALHNGKGEVVGAISVATPVTRFRAVFDAGLVAAMLETRRQLEIDIAANPAEAGP